MCKRCRCSVQSDGPKICFQYCKYLEGGAVSSCAPLQPLCPGLKMAFWLAEQSYLLGTTHATSGMPGFQVGPPGNLTATEVSVWFRLAHHQWRPHKDSVHQMKNFRNDAPHHALFAVLCLCCSYLCELLQHAVFQTFVFLLILEAAISITHAERVSVENNPIMFVFFAAFYCYLLLAWLQKPPLMSLFSFRDAAWLH